MSFWSEKSFCFSTKWLRFVACWFSFTLRWNDRARIKLRSDAFLKFLFKIRLKHCLKRETNLMQACSANQHEVIMPSWLPKVPSWLRKNALCLSQSALGNFTRHVITVENPISIGWNGAKLQVIKEIQISRHMTINGQTLGVFRHELRHYDVIMTYSSRSTHHSTTYAKSK